MSTFFILSYIGLLRNQSSGNPILIQKAQQIKGNLSSNNNWSLMQQFPREAKGGIEAIKEYVLYPEHERERRLQIAQHYYERNQFDLRQRLSGSEFNAIMREVNQDIGGENICLSRYHVDLKFKPILIRNLPNDE